MADNLQRIYTVCVDGDYNKSFDVSAETLIKCTDNVRRALLKFIEANNSIAANVDANKRCDCSTVPRMHTIDNGRISTSEVPTTYINSHDIRHDRSGCNYMIDTAEISAFHTDVNIALASRANKCSKFCNALRAGKFYKTNPGYYATWAEADSVFNDVEVPVDSIHSNYIRIHKITEKANVGMRTCELCKARVPIAMYEKHQKTDYCRLSFNASRDKIGEAYAIYKDNSVIASMIISGEIEGIGALVPDNWTLFLPKNVHDAIKTFNDGGVQGLTLREYLLKMFGSKNETSD